MYGLYLGNCSHCTDHIQINVHLLFALYSDETIMYGFYLFFLCE